MMDINETIKALKNHLNRKERYNRFNYTPLIKKLIIFIALVVSFIIVHDNLDKLNEIVLIILQLGSIIILIIIFLLLKYSHRLYKNVKYCIKYQKNLVKYILVIILLVLLWQAYINKDTLFDPVVKTYKAEDFNKYWPLAISISEISDQLRNFEDQYPKQPEEELYVRAEKVTDKSTGKTTDAIKGWLDSISGKDKGGREECMEVFNHLNELRSQKNLRTREWDERAYEMAVSRSKDMFERDYFSHRTPEGECMLTLKDQFGFRNNEIVAENIGGMFHYAGGNPTSSANVFQTLDDWIGSPGHNANLFYSKHISGAIGCYKAICTFNGIHNNPYGLGAAPCSMYK